MQLSQVKEFNYVESHSSFRNVGRDCLIRVMYSSVKHPVGIWVSSRNAVWKWSHLGDVRIRTSSLRVATATACRYHSIRKSATILLNSLFLVVYKIVHAICRS